MASKYETHCFILTRAFEKTVLKKHVSVIACRMHSHHAC